MSSVLLISPESELPADNRWRFGQHDRLLKSATQSTRHRLTEDAGEAAIILFTSAGPEPFHWSVTGTPWFRQHPAKCFVFDSADQPLALLPGVYPSIEKSWYDPRWTRSGCYIDDAEQFGLQPWQDEMPCLFSFSGSYCNAEVRAQLAAIHHPRARLVDTSGRVAPAYMAGDADAIKLLHETYVEAVRQSCFVLCPRGIGCSSQRIFEVMRMGRAPVILSDDWVPPVGPDWERFSVRVPEADVLALPEILGPLEASARQMGAAAHREWERWFAMPTMFDTVVDWCLDIQRAGKCGDAWFRRWKSLQILRPFHLRSYLRHLKQTWRASAAPE